MVHQLDPVPQLHLAPGYPDCALQSAPNAQLLDEQLLAHFRPFEREHCFYSAASEAASSVWLL
jgi:hypothetical protein